MCACAAAFLAAEALACSAAAALLECLQEGSGRLCHFPKRLFFFPLECVGGHRDASARAGDACGLLVRNRLIQTHA